MSHHAASGARAYKVRPPIPCQDNIKPNSRAYRTPSKTKIKFKDEQMGAGERMFEAMQETAASVFWPQGCGTSDQVHATG